MQVDLSRVNSIDQNLSSSGQHPQQSQGKGRLAATCSSHDANLLTAFDRKLKVVKDSRSIVRVFGTKVIENNLSGCRPSRRRLLGLFKSGFLRDNQIVLDTLFNDKRHAIRTLITLINALFTSTEFPWTSISLTILTHHCDIYQPQVHFLRLERNSQESWMRMK